MEHQELEHEELGALTVPAASRTRRTRMLARMRRIVRETQLEPSNFILPLFIREGDRKHRAEISTMPGVFQLGLDSMLKAAEEAVRHGLGGVILFGIPEHKDELGTEAYNPDGIIPSAVRELKQHFPELLTITDVCLCEYTNHGHCGVVQQDGFGQAIISNDASVELLVQEALVHAEAGADMIAPSDMMDGRVGAMRDALDISGFESLPIMSYSAKYASALYGPFREAAESTPTFGDRRSHQMDVANSDEAMRCVQRDIDEGADIVMVKPAMTSLDILRRIKDDTMMPAAAYQVSGEYSMILAAAQQGWIDEDRVILESLLAIKRAGASVILTYFATRAASLLRQ